MIISETCKDGVGKHVSDLIRHLDKSKYDIVVVHGTSRMDYYFEEMKDKMAEEVAFIEVPSFKRKINLVHELRAMFEINRVMDKYRPEIVHCHSSKAGVVGRLLALRKGFVKKIFYTPHAYSVQNVDLDSKAYRLYMLIERWLGNKEKVHTINVSRGEQSFALENGIIKSIGQSTVIYNAVKDRAPLTNEERKKKRDELGIKPTDILIVSVARLYYQKNPFLFWEIARDLCSRNEDVKFIWVGEGEYLDELRTAADEYNIKESAGRECISFVGSRNDVHEILSASDVYISTALYEGLPYTLIEACRAGVPMIASNITGNDEVVENNVNGLLYGNEDRNTWKTEGISRLEGLINNSEDRSTFGEQAREIFEERFTLQHMIESIENLYDDW